MLFSVHEQETEMRVLAHQINAWILMFVAVSRAVECAIAHYHVANRNESSNPERIRNTDESINPVSADQNVYQTLFPSLTALSLVLLGVWWIHMVDQYYNLV
jgi:hypothetical protein